MSMVPAHLEVTNFNDLFYGFPKTSTVWESHGDSVVKMPDGFESLASTETVLFAAAKHKTELIFGVQFHPESSHSEKGTLLFENFASRICKIPLKPKKINIDEMISQIKEKVGNNLVIGAFSGGTDSVVAGTLVARAIGKQFIPFYVDSGLARNDVLYRIKNIFPKILGLKVNIIEAKKNSLRFLRELWTRN